MEPEPLRILLVEDNPGDAVLVEEMLSEEDPDAFRLYRAGSLLEGLDQLAQVEVDAILLDLNLPDSQGLDTFTAMRTHAPEIPIVLLTGHDDDRLALSAVEAGAQDYLVKDRLNGETLVHAIRYAVVRFQKAVAAGGGRPPTGSGRVVGVLGGKGGVGATTVAAHLGAELRRQTGEAVLLADFDIEAGSLGFLMQVSARYSAADAAENVHRLDAEFWRAMVSRSGDGIDVLCSPGLFGRGAPPHPGRFRHVLRFARKQYPWTVVDLGRLDPLAVAVAGELDRIVLVTTAELMAVHDAGRVVKRLEELGSEKDHVSVVYNQAGRDSAGADLIESVLRRPVAFTLPACESELTEAYTKGVLLNGSSGFGRQLARLAASLRGASLTGAPASGFSLRRLSLFGARGRREPRAGSRG